ncbi:MAG: Zn-dependent hydrolase, partial [Gemmatimonadetes bacterium]|nr:Zn-dependent hydrolase [Gemmatimonadota bacterium]
TPAPASASSPAAMPAPVLVAAAAPAAMPDVHAELAKYTPVRLTANLAALTPNERRMIPLLIDAVREMDPIYWQQAYGSRDSLLAGIANADARRYVEVNYGPWDRLEGNAPFLAGVGAKPEGAALYPRDMTKAEFERAVAAGGPRADSLKSLYTVVRRDSDGRLAAVPYHVVWAVPLARAADKLRQAAALAEDAGLKRYLELRAQALLTDDFQASDLAWMDMKGNTLDVVIGPIETYEDALYGYKAANEGYVLIKDRDWSRRLAHYVQLLPALQRGIPVAPELKRETPGSNSDLNAYDVVYYAGQANAGAKTIAINLPNDEQVQLQKGTRRLQLKNAMRAKFDAIMMPIGRELIVPEQTRNLTFDAFFENTMFHEVAHGLGIKGTINGKGTVREALKERAGGLEEEKADVLGLYMVTQLNRQGELGRESLNDNFVTFLAGLFRSVRFGASDAHGVANMATFNFFAERGAFSRDPATGKYRVDFAKMQTAVNALSERILRLQGTGDYAGVGEFMAGYGVIRPELRRDLARLSRLGIPVDITFVQGMDVLQPPAAGR